MSADRLDEVKARAEQVHWTSTSIEQAMARLASSAADVPWLVSEVERLTRVVDAKPRQPLVVLNEYLDRAEKAEAEVARLTAERDALAARLARVEALAEEWDGDDSCDNRTCVPHRSADALRAALAGSEAEASDVDVCSGDADCTSELHVHGCFADTAGPCTNPDEHQPTEQEADRG